MRFSQIPSPHFYKTGGWVVALIGLMLFGLASVTLPSYSAQASVHIASLILGCLFVLVGFAVPVRVVVAGAQVPTEVGKMIRVLAVSLPLGGAALIVAALMPATWGRPTGYAVTGICAMIMAFSGFLPLSRKLPNTFYMGEMLSILASTGLWGKKEDSMVDQEFQRWTRGRVKGVEVGQPAPDGDVVTLSGETRKLSEFFPGDKSSSPIILNFGSYSCPHHRKRMDELHEVIERWEPRGASFLTIYTAEAHPEDRWKLKDQYVNDPEFNGNNEDFCFYSPQTQEARRSMAEWMIEKKSLRMTVVMDTMEDSLLYAYNSWPIRLYVIHQGNIVYTGDQGPFGYAPKELNSVLETLCDVR